jgi:hypothetical protein
MMYKTAAIAACLLAASCGSPPQGPGQPSKASVPQLEAAARYGVTASEKAAMTLCDAKVITPDQFRTGATAIKGARSLLNQPSAAKFDQETVDKAIAAAKAAWLLADAGFKVANASKITPGEAAIYWTEGSRVDAEFDAYLSGLP